MAQLHRKFTDSQVKEMLQRYLNDEIERPYLQEILVWNRIMHHNSNSDADQPRSLLVPFVRTYTPEDINRLDKFEISRRTGRDRTPDLYSLRPCAMNLRISRTVAARTRPLIQRCCYSGFLSSLVHKFGNVFF
jgi:hypothetical protein